MRLQVTLATSRRVVVPWNYQEKLMGFIYRILMEEAPQWAQWLHSQGFDADGKQFKLFTFSRLAGREPRRADRGLEMGGPIQWWVSSPIPEFVAAFGGRLLAEGRVRVGHVELPVASVRRCAVPPFEDGRPYQFRTLSPVVASTGNRTADGRFQKSFLAPDDPRFVQVLVQNLVRKRAAALGHQAPADGARASKGLERPVEMRIHPGFRSRLMEVHSTRIRGWELTLEIRGDPDLLVLAYEAGLGEHNAAGFGMLQSLGGPPGRSDGMSGRPTSSLSSRAGSREG